MIPRFSMVFAPLMVALHARAKFPTRSKPMTEIGDGTQFPQPRSSQARERGLSAILLTNTFHVAALLFAAWLAAMGTDPRAEH